ncbi:MAG: hypothetical protein ABMB14_26625, partial [Myxococcota bacterium]
MATRVWWLAAAGWTGCPGGPPGSTAPTPPPPTCANPDARADRAYDAVVLPGVGTDDRRFWGGGIVAA